MCRIAILFIVAFSGHLLLNAAPAGEGEKIEKGEITTQSTGHVTQEPEIAHGCPNAPRLQAGVGECSYYCKYVEKNNTWLYGYYPDGLYCWADDDGEDKQRLLGLCWHGVCYPLDHDNVTHLSTPADDIISEQS
ncbi:uncharacterized protein [Dermacentor albipictus]|uniref:uncharacterized protein n=1 Tax=Dermacentor albipictus TaxID=60249 RepID=UPI0031FC98E6